MDNAQKKRILILSGPTAVGKTEASLELAKKLNGEIINADSMQVYRGMDIGTAKITPDERAGVPHHLIDICDPDEDFDVVRFQSEAKRCIDDITNRGRIPILVGGTGFYIQAVLYDIDFTSEEPDLTLREELAAFAREHGEDALHDRLAAIDPDYAELTHAHNVKRVIRAIEYYEKTGKCLSEHNAEQRQKDSPYESLYVVLTLPREELYRRIDLRVDQMIDAGLVEEVQSLLDQGVSLSSTSMQGLGYKEIAAYLNGDCTKEEAIYMLKRDTRHFAKRQLTWYKRERDIFYIEKQNYKDPQLMIERIVTEFNKR